MMRHLSHRYRVRVIQRPGTPPQVQGVEELTVNGQRRVHYFDPSAADTMNAGFAPFWEVADPVAGFVRGDRHWQAVSDEHSRAPRPIPVEVVSPAERSPLSSLRRRWQAGRRWLQATVRKLARMGRHLPAAVQVAWRELNR